MTQRRKQTRRLLLTGFGGLVFLLAAIGVDTLSVLRQIETRDRGIREDYYKRDRILEQLRSDIYLSGTYVRDLLLEPDPARAQEHRREFDRARTRIESSVAEYQPLLRPPGEAPFRQFVHELASYFDSLSPALAWNASERSRFGYGFMTTNLLPRRTTIVQLADRIGEVNQKQLQDGDTQVSLLFAGFRRSFTALMVLVLLCGGLLAAGTVYLLLRLERASDLSFHQAEQARADLRELSARLIEVQESERRALARELHDEVGQALSALLLGLGNVDAILPSGNPLARAELAALRGVTEKTVAVVRDMSLLLRPSMLDDLGLIPALQWQAREVSRANNLPVHISTGPFPDDLPEDHRTCIYRIVQEALRNVIRHAAARSVQIHLGTKENTLSLTIADDGRGFDPGLEKGIGLLGMEERVAHLHGSFQLTSAPGRGATIHVELPTPRESPVPLPVQVLS